MIEWQKFTQGETEISDDEKFLEFLDLRARTTELTMYGRNQRKQPQFLMKSQGKPSEYLSQVTTHVTNIGGKCFACQKPSIELPIAQYLRKNPFQTKGTLYLLIISVSTA